MKITYTREEISKIILDHCNATVYGKTFNSVKPADYNTFPREFEVAYEAPAVEETHVEVAV